MIVFFLQLSYAPLPHVVKMSLAFIFVLRVSKLSKKYENNEKVWIAGQKVRNASGCPKRCYAAEMVTRGTDALKIRSLSLRQC